MDAIIIDIIDLYQNLFLLGIFPLGQHYDHFLISLVTRSLTLSYK